MTQTFDRQPSGLYVQSPDRQPIPSESHETPIAFPLKHTEVNASIAGNISRVEVIQTFENPFTTTLEAVYIFPLPDEAAVDEMTICIGDRRITGKIKPRQEAQQLYEHAKQQGQTAGLLEQERDNIFMQSLANIQPGESIDVIIHYTTRLKFSGSQYEFVFPMVVAPRYIPGTPIADTSTSTGSAVAPMTLNQDTDLVPDASRLNAPILPPEVRSRHDIEITLCIDAGVEIRSVHSPSHPIHLEQRDRSTWITLAAGTTIPNQDFIVRYEVMGDHTQATVLSQADDRGGHFALYLIPALCYQPEQVVPKEVVFLIDTSGSQAGDPLRKCQELMRRCVNGLNPNDTFTIIDFSDAARQLSPVPLTNTPQNRQAALRYIDRLHAGGGTEMLRGIRAVLNLPTLETDRLRSIVLLTDGFIGNENQILAEVQRHLKPGNRLHSFGAGTSVNRFLLNRIAEIGRGISRIIRPNEPTDTVAAQFFRAINNPVLTNIQLRWEGAGEAPMFYPNPIPDLFAEEPLVLLGRKADRQPGKLHLIGTIAGGYYQQTFDLAFNDTEQAGMRAIAQLWGRARLKDLTNRMVSGETKAGVNAVTETALRYQLLSQYTAFVAISEEARVDAPQNSISVQVPVEMPEGIHYDGIFGTVSSPVCAAPLDEFADLGNMPAPAAPRATRFRLEAMLPPSAVPEEIFSDLCVDFNEEDDSAPSEQILSESYFDFGEEDDSPELIFFDESDEAVFSNPDGLSAPAVEPQAERSPHRLQILKAEGLDQNAIALLQHYLLQSFSEFDRGTGTIAFECVMQQGRVRHLVWDEQASSLQRRSVIDKLRQLLLVWQPPQSLNGKVVLTIEIRTN